MADKVEARRQGEEGDREEGSRHQCEEDEDENDGDDGKKCHRKVNGEVEGVAERESSEEKGKGDEIDKCPDDAENLDPEWV